MKIRNGFVSNSSSSSFVVIEKGDLNQIDNVLTDDDYLLVDGKIGHYRFGWERDRYDDVHSKINFAYLQTQYANETFDYQSNEYVASENGKQWLKMLEEVLKEELKINYILWDITTDYNDKTKTQAYIDHQSNAFEGQNTEIFDSPETLKQFLFCSESYIQGGNDNG